jgi:hypothetical protein
MRSASINNILHKILLATAASGCGISTDGFDPPQCTTDFQPSMFGDVKLADQPDYIELRRREGFSPESEAVAETFGTPCATAADAGACQAAIANATSESAFRMEECSDVCTEYYLVVNRGDAVEVINTADGLRQLLGETDTPGEAVTMARLAGYSVSCEEIETGGVKATGTGFEVIASKLTSACTPVETTQYRLSVSHAGAVDELESTVYDSNSGACIGRRPSCMQRQSAQGKTRLGAYFGSVAHLEEVAVFAFAELARELAHHGAPAELIERAERSRRDEIRHGRIMRALADRFGGDAPEPRVTEQPPRSLEELARDNAVEGCVRETFGALVGMWQGRFARDRGVRAAMRRVAVDETSHAALSWDIDRWARSRLDAEANARIDAARDDALRELVHESPEDDEDLVRWAGLPSPNAHRELARRFVRECATVGG